jgi:4-hydroxy-tetrahydrodipicolinate reductase
MVNITVAGALGRMGKMILALASADKEIKISGEIDLPNADTLKTALSQSDVLIDFTSVESTLKNIETCVETNTGIVIGTTGLSAENKKVVEAASKKIPIVFSPNMSVGVNVLFQLVAEAVGKMPGYDIEIVELHHNKKKDAPSGTAMYLAEVAKEARGGGEFQCAREGIIGERPASEIGIQAVRGGDIVGEHTVYLIGKGERLELTHIATSREQFATGAVRAAKWLKGKPAGLYTMNDVLK